MLQTPSWGELGQAPIPGRDKQIHRLAPEWGHHWAWGLHLLFLLAGLSLPSTRCTGGQQSRRRGGAVCLCVRDSRVGLDLRRW